MITLACIPTNAQQPTILTVNRTDLAAYIQKTVGPFYGLEKVCGNLYLIYSHLLEKQNTCASRIFCRDCYDTVIALTYRDDRYESLSDEDIEAITKQAAPC